MRRARSGALPVVQNRPVSSRAVVMIARMGWACNNAEMLGHGNVMREIANELHSGKDSGDVVEEAGEEERPLSTLLVQRKLTP